MARKTKVLTIETDGRDKGKTFLLTEMSAFKAEKWATRALLALLRSGLKVPDEVAKAGLAGVASLGASVLSGIQYDDAEPLLEEMMTCVQWQDTKGTRAVMEVAGDIEEVQTLFQLRKEVLELHLGFSIADKLSTSAGAAGKAKITPTS